jgi:hypothetical protein
MPHDDAVAIDNPLAKGNVHYPVEYKPDAPSGDVEQVAGGEGTPGNNQAQNKQFKVVVKALGLNRDQAPGNFMRRSVSSASGITR